MNAPPQGPYPPPPVPEGWVAVWDPNSQRYYFIEQASGRTQWEPPVGSNSGPGGAVGGLAMPSAMPSGMPNAVPNTMPSAMPSGIPGMPSTSADPSPYGYPASYGSQPYPSSSGSPQTYPPSSPAYPPASSPGQAQSYAGNEKNAYGNQAYAGTTPSGQQPYTIENQSQQPGQGQPVGPDGERGMGSVAGGAVAGALLGYAANKFFGHDKHKPPHHGHGGYAQVCFIIY
ncbi:uncharacterized protein BYT42DRAFT_569950 [Radiomyces spectabilis]|uniref:uncharacterized protein n=1 Tax=Radiomyces spectabilis TaxID=64574 RepID=UPI00221F09EB|nr:uncharacterized protein BYT42DRAFT_569950 [Radiomyces spectabilis]KAI8379767.1 hypothetical protein BYT42DRAFT_569950 [Radiomyces spectabilis]